MRLSTMRFMKLWAGMLTSAVVVAACGGSTDSGLKGTGGSSGSGGAGGAAAAGGAAGAPSGGAAGAPSGGASGAGGSGASSTGGSSGYTLDDICQKTQPKGCEWSKDCCTKSGFGYDADGCVKRALDGCSKNVEDVKAGKMTFDPSKVDVCLAVYQKLLGQCTLGVNEFLLALDELKACGLAFQGKVPTGASCDRDEECAPSADPNVFVGCDEDTGKCTASKRLSLNATCAVGDNVPDFCAPGLYCDATWSPLPPYPGICKQATAVGQKCNAFKPYNLECGAGFYCNKDTNLCTKAKVGGAACAETLECQSFACDFGKCAPLEPLVDQQACTG
jgi:hypothetical protein